MILNSGENCVRSSLWHFRWFFSQLLGQSCTSAVCPRSFLCAWCQKLHCRGLVVLMTLDGSVMVVFFFFFFFFFYFAIFFAFFCFFFQRRFERGRFSCKGGRDMAGKIPTTFAVSCGDSQFFFFFSLFSPFPLLPSLFSFFPHFSNNLSSPSPIFRFFQRFLVKTTRLSVTPSLTCVPREAPPTSERDTF